MKLDVDALGTFYEMAQEGAGLATSRLTAMTGLPARVGVTHVNFAREASVRRDLDDGVERSGVRVSLSEGVAGTSILLFDEESARTVAETVTAGTPAADPEAARESAVTEVGQIMNNGYVDGWANVLGTTIDVSPPTYVEGSDPGAFLAASSPAPGEAELAIVFRNAAETVEREVTFRHYLLPDRDTVERLFQRRGSDRSIELEKLAGFDRIAHRGAEAAADSLSTMTGIDASVDIRRINFVSLDAIPNQVSTEPQVSVAFSFSGMPSGYLLILLDERSARALVGAALDAPPAETFGAFERDTVQELANVMASGMLDGWANLLETRIDHSTPAYAHEMGAAAVDTLVVGLGGRQEFAFVFDTQIRAVDTELDVDVFVIPDEADLKDALASFELDAVERTSPTASTELPADSGTDGADPDEFDWIDEVED
ncbi:chemotaxis protein CheC [Halobacteriales archaeon QS_5_70_15]|nr:MAG: chemotaxis protein CheC [Halobacteriales archaeon QS_5_70_15]